MAQRARKAATEVGKSKGVDPWTGESIRYSFFYAQTAIDPVSLWTSIAGAPPETVSERPAQGVKQAQGSFGPGQLNVTRQTNRVDIHFGPNAPTETSFTDSPFVQIGARLEAQKQLTVEKIDLRTLSEGCNRVAYAPTAFIPRTSISEANKTAATYISCLKFEPENDRDLFLQINRPIFSRAIPNLRIYRVSKWQVAEMQLIQFSPEAGAGSKVLEASMFRVEIDISTDPGNGNLLNSANIDSALTEIVSFADSIFEHGDAA